MELIAHVLQIALDRGSAHLEKKLEFLEGNITLLGQQLVDDQAAHIALHERKLPLGRRQMNCRKQILHFGRSSVRASFKAPPGGDLPQGIPQSRGSPAENIPVENMMKPEESGLRC